MLLPNMERETLSFLSHFSLGSKQNSDSSVIPSVSLSTAAFSPLRSFKKLMLYCLSPWFFSGKKSPDLGEYDPLTQADSDESEDDLVLNIQKNGGVKNGKSPPEEIQDPDSDVEVGMTKQHMSESTPEGYPEETAGSLEQKATPSLMPYLRTAIFLLTVVISMILVLVCAFLIPCPPRDLHNTWNRNLGQGAGEKAPGTASGMGEVAAPRLGISGRDLFGRVGQSRDPSSPLQMLQNNRQVAMSCPLLMLRHVESGIRR